MGHGLNRSGSVQGLLADCCECGNEPSVSIKCELLGLLRTCYLLRKTLSHGVSKLLICKLVSSVSQVVIQSFKAIGNALESLKVCTIHHVQSCPLIYVQDLLNICCEL